MSAIHIFFSVAPEHYSWSYDEKKQYAERIIKELGLKGAGMTYHPFRYAEVTGHYYSPQFHLICFGYIKGKIGPTYAKYRWYIGYVGPRNSIYQTLVYFFSHAGVRPRDATGKKTHAITWYGVLSNGKVKSGKRSKKDLCPCCKDPLIPIYIQDDVHPEIPPDKYFEGFVSPEGLYPLSCDRQYGIDDNKFDYDSRRDVNDVLKGLVEAK